MALPATINANFGWSDHKNMRQGPFEVGSALYAIGVDKSANKIRAYKSTNGGDTWTEQNSGSAPNSSSTANYKSVDCRVSGSIIYCFKPVSSTSMTVERFDTSTDTWSAQIAGPTITLNTNVSGTAPLFGEVRSDGSFVIFYQGATQSVMGTPYRRAKIHTRSSGGSWTGPFDVIGSANSPAANTLPGTQDDFEASGTLKDTSDRVYTITPTTNSSNAVRAFLSSNAFGSGAIVGMFAPTTAYQIGHAAAGATYFAVYNFDTAGWGNLDVLPFAFGNSPTFQTGRAAHTSGGNREITNSNPASLVEVGGKAWVFSVRDDNQNIEYKEGDGDLAGTWSNSLTNWKAITCNGISAAAITGAIGVLYLDGSTVKYDALSFGPSGYTLTPVAASTTFTPSSVTVNRNRSLTPIVAATEFTGHNVTLSKVYRLTITAASAALTPSDVDITRSRLLTPLAANTTLTPASVTVTRSRQLVPVDVSVSFTPSNVAITRHRFVTPDPVAVEITGEDVSITRSRLLTPESADTVFTGYDVTITHNAGGNTYTLNPDPVSVSFAPQEVALTRTRTITPVAEALTFSPQSVTVTRDRLLTPDTVAAEFTGHNVTISHNVSTTYTLTPLSASGTFVPQSVTLTKRRRIEPQSVSTAFTGQAVQISRNRNVTPLVASVAFTLQSVEIKTTRRIIPQAANIAFVAQPVTITKGRLINPQPAASAFSGFAVDISHVLAEYPGSCTVSDRPFATVAVSDANGDLVDISDRAEASVMFSDAVQITISDRAGASVTIGDSTL